VIMMVKAVKDEEQKTPIHSVEAASQATLSRNSLVLIERVHRLRDRGKTMCQVVVPAFQGQSTLWLWVLKFCASPFFSRFSALLLPTFSCSSET
jgi:hypothetical protein